MRDYLILVGVQLKGLFGINRFFRQKGSGAGKTARAVGASLLILFAIAFFVGAAALYNYFFLADLHVSAREDLLYSAAFGFLFLILLLTYLFLTAGSLYGGKDYELLASCPVSHRTVVLSKLTGYYLIGLLITVVYMVPAMVFYALYASVSPFFYPDVSARRFARLRNGRFRRVGARETERSGADVYALSLRRAAVSPFVCRVAQ